MDDRPNVLEALDPFTKELLDDLFRPCAEAARKAPADREQLAAQLNIRVGAAIAEDLTGPILDLFEELRKIRQAFGLTPEAVGVSRETLIALAMKHGAIDEHGVTVGGRIARVWLPLRSTPARERTRRFSSSSAKARPSKSVSPWSLSSSRARMTLSIVPWN